MWKKNKCGCNQTSVIEANTGCTPTPCNTPDPCGSITPVTSCCGNALQTTSVPYYQQVAMCPEDNKQRIIIEKLVGALKTIAGFAMPACGAKVKVFFDKAGEVPIGAWLWAYGIGVLEITGFNPFTGEIEVRNNCPENQCQPQAAPGTPIPGCTVFLLMAPTCGSASGGPSSLFPFLAVDFTAPPVVPAVGSCIDITLTNVNGLAVNKNISINGGIYRVDAITSATLITICNDGAGLVPGTPVIAKDGAGNFIVPIILIDSNVCSNPPVLSGQMLVCKAGITQPLEGTDSGQIPVLDNVTGEVNFRTLGIPVLDCTELTVSLTLDPINPPGTSYLAIAVSTAAFSPLQILTIGGTQFTVDTIDDATHLHMTPVVDPVVVTVYPVGSALCSADCCTILSDRLTRLYEGDFTYGGISTGAANVYNINVASEIASYTDGLRVQWRAHQSNTISTPTLNVNGIGAVTLTGDGGQPLVDFGIFNNYLIDAEYIAAVNSFRVLNELAATEFELETGIPNTHGWVPVITAGGAMTIANTVILTARYVRMGPYIHFQLAVQALLGGVANREIYITAPVLGIGEGPWLFPLYALDGPTFATGAAGWRYDNTQNKFLVDYVTWTVGQTAQIFIDGKYRVTA